jgi:hypothetical protein
MCKHKGREMLRACEPRPTAGAWREEERSE